MKYILCQPASVRFDWELKTCLSSLERLGVAKENIILLFSKSDDAIVDGFKAGGYDVHVYSDARNDKSYLSSIKPYLWWKYLEENSNRENEMYMYVDSDVIFRDLINVDKLSVSDNCWAGSDCNSYLNLDYILRHKNGSKVAENMAKIVGVTLESIKTINSNSAGAQWIIKHPTTAYWKKVYEDSNKLWEYFASADSDIQGWTAEMWSQLWNMIFFNIGVKIEDELAFAWSPEGLDSLTNRKILHNAGVSSDMPNMFLKSQYTTKYPALSDLKNLDEYKCSSIYANYVREALYGNR